MKKRKKEPAAITISIFPSKKQNKNWFYFQLTVRKDASGFPQSSWKSRNFWKKV